jgi:2-polyprenyl-3-methyl-5-hydroxy-6-metoxy-1,4-benzoquinol methylase
VLGFWVTGMHVAQLPTSQEPVSQAERPLCVVCGESGAAGRFVSRDFQYKIFGRFHVSRCSGCGLDRLDPIPSADEIDAFYSRLDLYPYGVARSGLLAQLKMQLGRRLIRAVHGPKQGLAGRLAYPIAWLLRRRMVPLDPEGRTLFEVGAGNGAFLQSMQRLGWRVAGCELSHSGVEAARTLGLAVDQGTLESGHYQAELFDVLRLDQVFEHLHDPRGFLREAYRVIKPGGFMIIGVPNADAASYALFGPYWGLLGVPFHLVQYSSRALEALIEEAGFVVQWFRYIPMPICWVWSANNFINEQLGSLSDRGLINNCLARLLMTFIFGPILRLILLLFPKRAEVVMVYARRPPHLDAT